MNYNRLQFGSKKGYFPNELNIESKINILSDSLLYQNDKCDTLIEFGGAKSEINFIKITKTKLIYSNCDESNVKRSISNNYINEIRFSNGKIGRFKIDNKDNVTESKLRTDAPRKSGNIIKLLGAILTLVGAIAIIVFLAVPIQILGWISLGLFIIGLITLTIGLVLQKRQGTIDYNELGGWLIGLGIAIGILSLIVGIIVTIMGGGIGLLILLGGSLLASIPIYFGTKFKTRNRKRFVIE